MTDPKHNLLSRRQLLRQALGTSLCVPFANFLGASLLQAQTSAPAHPAAAIHAGGVALVAAKA